MNYPDYVIIRGARYRILYHNDSREVDSDLARTDLLGHVAHQELTIRIYRRQSTVDLLDTLIHETLHAILVRNKALRLCLKEGAEECLVDTLANELALILFENRWFQPEQTPPLTTRISDCTE